MKGEERLGQIKPLQPINFTYWVESQEGATREVTKEEFYMMAEFDLLFFQENIVREDTKFILRWAI